MCLYYLLLMFLLQSSSPLLFLLLILRGSTGIVLQNVEMEMDGMDMSVAFDVVTFSCAS